MSLLTDNPAKAGVGGSVGIGALALFLIFSYVEPSVASIEHDHEALATSLDIHEKLDAHPVADTKLEAIQTTLNEVIENQKIEQEQNIKQTLLLCKIAGECS